MGGSVRKAELELMEAQRDLLSLRIEELRWGGVVGGSGLSVSRGLLDQLLEGLKCAVSAAQEFRCDIVCQPMGRVRFCDGRDVRETATWAQEVSKLERAEAILKRLKAALAVNEPVEAVRLPGGQEASQNGDAIPVPEQGLADGQALILSGLLKVAEQPAGGAVDGCAVELRLRIPGGGDQLLQLLNRS